VIFETDRLNIRNLVDEDAAAFITLQTDHCVMRYVGGAQSTDQAKADLDKCIRAYAEVSDLWLIWAVVIRKTGQFIGTCACIQGKEDGEIEIGFRLLPLAWNQGYASELVPHLIGHALKGLKANRVVASVDMQNIASMNVLDKCMIFQKTQYNAEEQSLDRLYYTDVINIV